ncbi:MAG: prolipoprotein diacylglyceryl transferase [Tepidisphaeraceae bacterium]|jgi:phosphatidylglycerol:prolipoprotein diacylglycerol transferase
MVHALSLIHYPQIDPVMFQIGPLKIRWYGMAYLTGFVLAYLVLGRLVRQNVLRISKEALSDLVGWLALGVVAGGRTGWWIFYHRNIPGQPERWWEPMAIWHGGMSFHGGLAGVLIVLWIWCKYQRAPLLNAADCLALVTPIGLFLGRIANFINGELVGRATTVPWAMIFPGYPQPRHPSQIYEAILEGPVLLGVVWAVKRWKGRRDGQIAATFVIAYAIIRFLVEFTREPDVQVGYIAFGWLTMGQLLSVAIGLAGAAWWMALNFSKSGTLPPQTTRKK